MPYIAVSMWLNHALHTSQYVPLHHVHELALFLYIIYMQCQCHRKSDSPKYSSTYAHISSTENEAQHSVLFDTQTIPANLIDDPIPSAHMSEPRSSRLISRLVAPCHPAVIPTLYPIKSFVRFSHQYELNIIQYD